jgi:hypothetical protein
LRQAAEELTRRRHQIDTARKEAAEAARLDEANRARQEAEKHHQNEVERLQNEEQAFRFAAEETVRHRAEVEALRRKAEADIAALTEERNRLVADAEAQIKQLKEEREQLLAAEASRRAEAEGLSQEARERKRIEEAQLKHQLDVLTKQTAELATRRAEVEASAEKARQDADNLSAALARMKAAEEARERIERERLQVETMTNQRVQSEQRLLDEARRRAAEEQARLEEEKRRHDQSEKGRMDALEEVHRKTELEAKQVAEREMQLHGEIDHLRIADAEARRRIEEAETQRRTSEQAYRLVAEKAQRLEAEAHAASLQEEQMLAKLEGVRREVANEAQTRSEQAKRIKEEIEEFRRLHDEERPLLEAAILQRTAAAARLQQMRDSRTEIPRGMAEQHHAAGASIGGASTAPSWPEQSSATNRPRAEHGSSFAGSAIDEGDLPSLSAVGGSVQPAVGQYLNSLDPYKRAAAVAELARSQGTDAFSTIARCFDDHAPQVRNAAALALCQLDSARTVDFLNRAMEEGSPERRRNIGGAIAGSGLAAESIDNLASESREETYSALSILFVMAKTGEVQPLVKAIEEHQNEEVRRAAIKLLTLSGRAEVAEAAVKKRAASST